jgi:RNA recognition motif-containing protein
MEGCSALREVRGRDMSRDQEKDSSMGNRIYVGNLPFSATTEALRAAFAPSGEVTDVHIVTDRESGQSRGFGFVTMGNANEAAKAIAQMNGTMLDGRPLRVNEADERPQRSGGFGGGGRRNNGG